MYSLKKSLTKQLIFNMVMVMSGLLVILYFSMQHLIEDYILTRLQQNAESLISVIYPTEKNFWQIDPSKFATIYNRVRSGHYYQVQAGTQTITSRSLFDTEFPLPKHQTSPSGHYKTSRVRNETWLVWHQQVIKKEQLIKLWIAEDITPVQHQLLRYTAFAAGLVFITTIMLIYLQWRTLNESFNIFEKLRQNLSSIRLKETEKMGLLVPVEIYPLINEIERLVEQLQNRIQRTRHAIGNLAHELKRPLQLLSLQQEENPAKKQIKPLQDIKSILERELKRAKISGSSGIGGEFDINEELPYLIDVMKQIYPRIEIKLENPQQITVLDLDRDDMLELTGNILDNACKFASHNVLLEIHQSPELLLLTFEDDGKGIGKAQIDAIKKRGVRLDESREGHGLGLGICWDIVNSYHGDILMAPSAMGGLQVQIKLPYKGNNRRSLS